eukprot:111970-Rhodomonas_salina.1
MEGEARRLKEALEGEKEEKRKGAEEVERLKREVEGTREEARGEGEAGREARREVDRLREERTVMERELKVRGEGREAEVEELSMLVAALRDVVEQTKRSEGCSSSLLGCSPSVYWAVKLALECVLTQCLAEALRGQLAAAEQSLASAERKAREGAAQVRALEEVARKREEERSRWEEERESLQEEVVRCLLYTSDAADDM